MTLFNTRTKVGVAPFFSTLGGGGSARPTVSLVQQVDNSNKAGGTQTSASASASYTPTPATAYTAGNVLIGCFTARLGGPTAPTLTGWTKLGAQVGDGTYTGQLYGRLATGDANDYPTITNDASTVSGFGVVELANVPPYFVYYNTATNTTTGDTLALSGVTPDYDYGMALVAYWFRNVVNTLPLTANPAGLTMVTMDCALNIRPIVGFAANATTSALSYSADSQTGSANWGGTLIWTPGV